MVFFEGVYDLDQLK